MSVIVAYSAAATGSPLNKAKPPKHSLNETGKFIILRLTVSPKIFPHCCYATPKAHQYFPLPPSDAPIFIPDIETL